MTKYLKQVICYGFILILVASGCKKDKYDATETLYAWFEIPAGLGTVLSYNFRARNITGLVATGIKSAQCTGLRLYLEDGDNSFEIVRQAYLYISTDTSLTEIGYNLDVPAANNQWLTLLADIVDPKDYFSQSTFDLTLKLNMRASTTQTSRIRAEITVGLKY